MRVLSKEIRDEIVSKMIDHILLIDGKIYARHLRPFSDGTQSVILYGEKGYIASFVILSEEKAFTRSIEPGDLTEYIDSLLEKTTWRK